jgi:hypothetical protein
MVVGELPQHTALRVLAGSGEYFRVALPDGATGYVAARLTEPTERPLSEQVATRGETVVAPHAASSAAASSAAPALE